VAAWACPFPCAFCTVRLVAGRAIRYRDLDTCIAQVVSRKLDKVASVTLAHQLYRRLAIYLAGAPELVSPLRRRPTRVRTCPQAVTPRRPKSMWDSFNCIAHPLHAAKQFSVGLAQKQHRQVLRPRPQPPPPRCARPPMRAASNPPLVDGVTRARRSPPRADEVDPTGVQTPQHAGHPGTTSGAPFRWGGDRPATLRRSLRLFGLGYTLKKVLAKLASC